MITRHSLQVFFIYVLLLVGNISEDGERSHCKPSRLGIIERDRNSFNFFFVLILSIYVAGVVCKIYSFSNKPLYGILHSNSLTTRFECHRASKMILTYTSQTPAIMCILQNNLLKITELIKLKDSSGSQVSETKPCH